MKLIDTHCHLYLEDFEKDIDKVINRANQCNVTDFFLPAISSNHISSMYELETRFPKKIKLMMGLHPCSVDENFKEELDQIKSEITKRPFYAIGEIGLDYYWSKKYQKHQQEAFEIQIEWALNLNLPIVIHTRESFEHAYSILKSKKQKKLRGIFHCFSGSLKQAFQAIDIGFYLGIGGVVTFKNGGLDKILNRIPIDRIVLETDAPYLSPSPYRGKRNEPAYLEFIVRKISECYNESPELVAEKTTQNAIKVFETY
ncbi:MAG: TatD family hydrolase [Flavobacteriaceae bacterium]|nr:TatD family hydrolase [Flavobacteriaceae bacterium]